MDLNNKKIVDAVSSILSEAENNAKWESAYKRYAHNLMGNNTRYSNARKRFRLPKPMYAYSSISLATNSPVYDIRVHGQSVGLMQISKKIPYLTVSEKKATNTVTYFKLPYLAFIRDNWATGDQARSFRAMFKGKKFGKLKSEEHRIENLLLAEFSKKLRTEEKKLCNIQPVKLGECFFQLTTPLKASTHAPSFSMNDKGGATGGGIDILARVKHSPYVTRLAIIELKDDNKKEEPQEEVMFQALSYATFMAYLLRSESAKQWWNLFKFSGDVPSALDLDVITLMPKGDSKEGDLNPIFIESLNVTLHPITLYYEIDNEGDLRGFSGTLMDSIYQFGK